LHSSVPLREKVIDKVFHTFTGIEILFK
jgi:hypothetical protein